FTHDLKTCPHEERKETSLLSLYHWLALSWFMRQRRDAACCPYVLVTCVAVRYTRMEVWMYQVPRWGGERTSDEDGCMCGPMQLSLLQRALSTDKRRGIFNGICQSCTNL